MYSYEIKFTNATWMPWKFSVYLDGKIVTDHPSFTALDLANDYTGSAAYAWSAKWEARKFIRKHRKHRGKVIKVGR